MDIYRSQKKIWPVYRTDPFLYCDQSEKGAIAMEYTIIWVNGHIEVYDANGEFWFSADTRAEVREELMQIA